MRVIFIILCFVTVSLGQSCPIEDGWKGIKTFQTSRADVEKKLGKPIKEDSEISYKTEEALIHVTYSSAPCGNENRGSFTIPKDTVLNYEVQITDEQLKFSGLEWKKEMYDEAEDFHYRFFTHYFNQEIGLLISTNKTSGTEMLKSLRFGRPAKMTAKYKCKDLK